jgi:hypothetical protein
MSRQHFASAEMTVGDLVKEIERVFLKGPLPR